MYSEEFEDTKGVIRICINRRRTDNTMAKIKIFVTLTCINLKNLSILNAKAGPMKIRFTQVFSGIPVTRSLIL
jgi:hypothetical protein